MQEVCCLASGVLDVFLHGYLHGVLQDINDLLLREPLDGDEQVRGRLGYEQLPHSFVLAVAAIAFVQISQLCS